MDLSPRRRWPTYLHLGLSIALMAALNFQEWPSRERPQRVFSRGFVMICVLVVVLELILLNQLFGHPV